MRIDTKIPTVQDLENLREDMVCFRDAGFRLVVPVSAARPFLVDKFSGHLFMTLFPSNVLGFSFHERNRSYDIPRLPLQMKVEPYNGNSDISMRIGHRLYIIYKTYEDSQMKSSPLQGRSLYSIKMDFMSGLGVVDRSS